MTEAIYNLRESHNCPRTFDTYFTCTHVRYCNSLFLAKSLEAAGNEAGSGMYPVYSMANHSCAASAMAIVGGSAKGYELQLRAQVPIRKVGERQLWPHLNLPWSNLFYFRARRLQCGTSVRTSGFPPDSRSCLTTGPLNAGY